MKSCQRCLAFRLNCAVSKLSVFFHPNAGICAISIEKSSQTAETTAQKGGSCNADTYSIFLAVTVKVSIYKLIYHVHHFIHSRGDIQIQLFQPVGTNPHKIYGIYAATGYRKAVLHALLLPCQEGRIAFLIHNFFGEIGCILFKNRPHFLYQAGIDKLHHLCGGDAHNIGKIFTRHGYVHLLVEFIIAFNNPVIYNFDSQLFLVGVQPEVIFQGLARKVGENVGFDGVIGGADKMDFQRIGIFAEGIGLR